MLWYGVLFLFVTGNMFSFMLDSSSGITATTLTASVTAADRYLPIANASGFLASDVRVFLEDEEVSYDSIISTATADCSSPPCLDTGTAGRGTNDTDAAGHDSGTKVLSETAGLVNKAVSLRVGNLDTTVGKLTFPFLAVGAIAKFVGKAVMWDYSFLEGNAVYVKYVLLYPLSFLMVMGLLRVFTDAASRFIP